MFWVLLKNLLGEYFAHTKSRLVHRNTVHDLYIRSAEQVVDKVVLLDETRRNVIRKTGRQEGVREG